jgi:hypothetical protein
MKVGYHIFFHDSFYVPMVGNVEGKKTDPRVERALTALYP